LVFPSETDISEPKQFEGEILDFQSLSKFLQPFAKSTKSQQQQNNKQNKQQQQHANGFDIESFKLTAKNGNQLCGLESGHLCVVLFANDKSQIPEVEKALVELRRKFGNKFKFTWAIEKEQSNFHSYFVVDSTENSKLSGNLLVFNEKKHAWNNDFSLDVSKLDSFLLKLSLGDIRFTRRTESSSLQSVLQLLN